jgi:NTE family protein
VLQALLRRSRGDRAVEADGEPARPQRPAIALALGGGVARGFAHIGVLRTLYAHGIVPEIVAGTSIGAVVGGCLAAGAVDAFEEWALGLTRRRLLGYLDLTFRGPGLIRGGKLARRLEDAIGRRTRIEDLPVRFAAIATELSTGHEVWLTRGRLLEALRASYAMPGVFAPVRVGGRWLVDGALVNPVPVSAARALDARVVIAVNLSGDLVGRGATIPDHGVDEDDAPLDEELPQTPQRHRGAFSPAGSGPRLRSVMIDAYNVMQDRITRSRLAGDPADVMITPQLADIGMFDFHRAEEAIRRGAEAAEQSLKRIDQVIAALA